MAIIQLRVSDELKVRATSLYNKLGLDLSTAIRMFLLRSVIENGIPFSTYLDETQEKSSEGLEALKKCQEESRKNGTDKMTLEEINKEISLARQERKKQH